MTHDEPSVATGPTRTGDDKGGLPVQTGKQQMVQKDVRIDQKLVDASSPEQLEISKPSVPVTRTDPGQLHQLVSRRIEESLSSKQEVTPSTSREVKSQVTSVTHEELTIKSSKTSVSVVGTSSVSKDSEEGKTPSAARLRSEPAEGPSTDDGQVQAAAKKTKTDVRQVTDVT